METEKYFPCSCGSEILGIMYDDEDSLIYLTMYYYGAQDHRASWKERFRWCWKILTTGKIFADEFLMDPSTGKGVGEFLLDIRRKWEIKVCKYGIKGEIVASERE